MLLQVPIRYKATGIRKGNSTSSTVACCQFIPVSILNPSSDEAPICAEWNDLPIEGMQGEGEWYAYPRDEIVHVRNYANKYWRPIFLSEVSAEKVGCILGAAESLMTIKNGHLNSMPRVRQTVEKDIRQDSDYFEVITASGRAKETKAVEIAAEKLMIVDDVIYKTCLEPMVVLKTARISRRNPKKMSIETGCVIRIVTNLPPEHEIGKVDIYPLHMFDEALRVAKRKSPSHAPSKRIFDGANEAKRPKIYSEYFSDPDIAMSSHCTMQLRHFLAIIDGNRVEKLPFSDRRKIRLLCDLWDALDDMPSDIAFNTLEVAGERYLRLYGGDQDSLELTVLRRAIESAEERTINILYEPASFRL